MLTFYFWFMVVFTVVMFLIGLNARIKGTTIGRDVSGDPDAVGGQQFAAIIANLLFLPMYLLIYRGFLHFHAPLQWFWGILILGVFGSIISIMTERGKPSNGSASFGFTLLVFMFAWFGLQG